LNELVAEISRRACPQIIKGKGIKLDKRPGIVVVSADTAPPPPSRGLGALQLTDSRPPYIPIPDPPTHTEGKAHLWVTIGMANGKLADNYLDTQEEPVTKDIFVALKIIPSGNVDVLEISEMTIDCKEDTPQETTAWGSSGEFPEEIYIPLGMRHKDTLKIENWGRGNVELRTVLSNVEVGLVTKFHRSLTHVRMETEV